MIDIKMLVSDLDGTLLNKEHTIDELTAKTLQKIQQIGIKIVFATGRIFYDTKYIRNKAKIKADIIASNGASLHNQDDDLICQHNINKDVLTQIINLPIDEQTICINAYQNDDWLIDRDLPQVARYYPDSKINYKIVNFKKKSLDNVQKLCYISLHQDKLNELAKKLSLEFGEHIAITSSSNDCIEVMAKDINKGNTLNKLLNQYKIDPAKCIAFGDNLNDLEMLSLVGYGVVMENGNTKLKQKLKDNPRALANYEQGIAKYLIKLFNLKL